jgi:hypothetical protein
MVLTTARWRYRGEYRHSGRRDVGGPRKRWAFLSSNRPEAQHLNEEEEDDDDDDDDDSLLNNTTE